jgi:PadR family transcriptional regulator, regulatory protein PadR
MPTRELVAAATQPLLLAILAEGENYGYALIQRVKELSHGELVWTEGTLYPVLHRLEKDGLLEAKWKDAGNGRQRKYYRLTRSGTKASKSERAQWLAMHRTLEAIWNPPVAATL